MSAENPVILVPSGDDPLRRLAGILFERYQNKLPDLTYPLVLLPQSSAIPRFRRILRESAEQQGFAVLLPPEITTLNAWANRYADVEKRLLGDTARELKLLEILGRHPSRSRGYESWPLAESLLAFFDELVLHDVRLPESVDVLLKKIYDTVKTHASIDQSSLFSDEARLVHAAWNAWREHLRSENIHDRPARYVDGLTRSLTSSLSDTDIYVAGSIEFKELEVAWMKTLMDRKSLTLIWHGADITGANVSSLTLIPKSMVIDRALIPGSPYEVFLQHAFDSDAGELRHRAEQQVAQFPTSPATDRLILQDAPDAESEARIIDIQVRRWLIRGIKDIGIVTNDRKLARRVRALMERSGVELEDAGGWALSTTSVATMLARWLDCLEQDFHHVPLLDLLRSPFLQLPMGRAELDRLVYRLEQGVMRAFQITSGLDQYRYGIERARASNNGQNTEIDDRLEKLLDHIAAAAAPITALRGTQLIPASEFMNAFRNSLDRLGLWSGFALDAAGRELVTLLEDMHASSLQGGVKLSWSGFQTWLRRGLERRRYHPPLRGHGVELMSLAESRLYRFDAIVIAAAIREHLPGTLTVPPYFNDGIRAELGLPSIAQRFDAEYWDFRRLLMAAPHVLVTWRREQDGEKITPSPWVEQLRTFHSQAYASPLHDPELEWLASQPETSIADRTTPLPQPIRPPAARLPHDLIPTRFSATDYQRLMDCPYQFFAARGLGLAPVENIREEIEAQVYGRHVHRILQAFHSGISGLPGPWRGELNAATRADAETLLNEITDEVFAPDLRRRFISRGWRYRWRRCIPAYLDWEMQRREHWQVEATEFKKERRISGHDAEVTLTGRIDRIDRHGDEVLCIDYKTGQPPNEDAIRQGESVQLPIYTLLLGDTPVTQAMFLALGDGTVKSKSELDAPTLMILRAAVRDRLLMLKRGLDHGAPLPAWGDRETCHRCDMEGLCRREMWLEADSGDRF